MFNLQPTLEDNLIILRPLRESDFEPLYEIAKDPLIWEQHPCPNRYLKNEYSEFFSDSLKSQGALIIIDKLNAKIIGSSRFKPLEQVGNAVEIGWSFLTRKYWGGKYNSSMKTLMIDYALQFVDDIIFYVDLHNNRSQKAVEKISGSLITHSRFSYLMKKGERDLTYRINKQDWIKCKDR
ncbi:MAG: GNAT family N-acetyltransferase [Bacteroidetes bacterium]|nr:GNAT family N-acetyltransferase [Bacteroidota bacterium]